MTEIKIYGYNCQIGPDFFPCIHTCKIEIQQVLCQLVDFINMCDTTPRIFYKNGFFKANWNQKPKCLFQSYIDTLNDDKNFFVFHLYNINRKHNYLALKNIFYNDIKLENVLHT